MYEKSDLLDGNMPHDLLKEKGDLEPVVKQLASLTSDTYT
jgi:hypothetical protein